MSINKDEAQENLIEKKSNKSESIIYEDENPIVKVEPKSLDPTSVKKVSLGNDFYALTWFVLKKGTFDDIYLRGEKIFMLPQDYFQAYFNFIIFVFMLILSVVFIVHEALVNDKYFQAEWPLIVVRILLVVFTQINLSPEFEIAYAKFLYPLTHPSEFFHPNFAIYIGFMHIIVCLFTLVGLLIFITMADEFADPVINFAGICVLSELDNWVGDNICSQLLANDDLINYDKKPEENELNEEEQKDWDFAQKKRRRFKLNDLNYRLSVFQKMALMAKIKEEDFEIVLNEKVYDKCPWYIRLFENLFNYIPWRIIVPLLTIPLAYALPWMTQCVSSIEIFK